ncbi:hypothetical protein V1527DRAFT_455430 [Lipomyces starkeyi]
MSQSSALSLGGDLMSRAAQHKVVRSARVSSWDQKGLNEDAFVVMPGDTAVLADLEGPGVITHLWFVQTCRRIVGPGLIPYSKSGVAMMEIHNALGLNYQVLIKMYWDDEESPSVHAPIGDFFCVGHSMAANMQLMPFTVSVKPSEEKKFGGASAINCYLPMPFNRCARIEIEKENDTAYFQYFYIDYETNSLETQVPNLDGKSNYVILETEGAGAISGAITRSLISKVLGGMHGTGGEDYFSHGWGMQKNQFFFCGTIIHEEDVPNYQVSYRWHLPDPVRFNKKIKTLPGPKLDMLPVEQRLPRRPEFPPADNVPRPDMSSMSVVHEAKVAAQIARMEEFVKDGNEWLERRANDSRERARNNVKLAQDIRRRFLASLKQVLVPRL